MAINTSWKVEIGTVASPTNFTSRIMSMNIQQDVDVNVIGRGRAVFTLLNKDGALTPGGGGTYSSTDWFAQGVFITALTNTGGADTSTAVFHGIVVDFDLQDDGVYSTVTITALDGFTIGGKSVAPSVSPFSSVDYSTALAVAFSPTGYATVYAPLLGGSSFNFSLTTLNSENPNVISDNTLSPSTFADLWQTYAIPSANDVLWATTISTSGPTNYLGRNIPMTNTRDAYYRTDFVFDPSASVSGTDLPFAVDTFAQAFNNDTLITQAQVDGNFTGSAIVTSTASTSTSYGSRTVAYTETVIANATGLTDMATKLTNRYSTSRFTPVSLSLSATMVKARCADGAHARWYTLLSIADGLWQKATITWTGSGASNQTANCVIRGRSINVTPSDTVVTLNLTNWVDNHGFILDTDKLDTDRLG